jgi:uncharacterized RDD family membrane protein YckC
MSQPSGEIDSRVPIDSHIPLVTPENIAFQYELAGPSRRLIAYLIDVLLRIVVILGAGFAIVLAGFAGLGAGVGLGAFLVLWFVLSWFYGGLFETFWNGQTPGKWVMGLRVLTRDGQPINALQAVLRNVLREVDSMPFVPIETGPITVLAPMYTLGLATMMLTERYERLGDLACGTMVVIERRHLLKGVLPVDSPTVREFAASLPANYVPSPSLARALSAYMDRRRYFGTARRAEIACIVGEPLAARFNLPPGTSHDLLLCALYYHVFVAERGLTTRKPPGGMQSGAGGISVEVLPLTDAVSQGGAFRTELHAPSASGGSSSGDVWS